MFTGIVSNIIAFIQRLCQICIAWCHVCRDCQILQLGVRFTEIVSNIIAWCHAYKDWFKYL